MAKKNKINIFSEDIKLPYKKISKTRISKISSEILNLTGTGPASVTLIICGNDYISRINSEFRKKKGPTDVISFAARESDFPTHEKEVEDLGEVYISVEKAESQSAEFEVTLDAEIKRLVIHGILHLLGYDHERSRKDEKIMSSLEDELMSKIE